VGSLMRVCMLAGFSLLLPACGINTIPTQEEKVNSAWAMVEVQYQRRADLIPNLVSTVKGAAAQELELFSRIAELRTGGPQKLPQSFLGTLSSDPEKLRLFLQHQEQLGSGLGRLLAIAEAYPELKSNQNFLTLQSQIEGSENRIAVARRDFVVAIERYNVTLKTFPGVLWKKWLYPSAEPVEQYFESQSGSDSAPIVEF
jgi:LemA protein